MTRVTWSIAALALLVGLCASVASAREDGATFTVRSSLDGKKVLPHRIRCV
jgi:hypothetical protein